MPKDFGSLEKEKDQKRKEETSNNYNENLDHNQISNLNLDHNKHKKDKQLDYVS